MSDSVNDLAKVHVTVSLRALSALWSRVIWILWFLSVSFYIFTQLYLVFLVRPSFKFSLTHGFCFWDVDTSCTLSVILHPSCMCEWCYFLVFIFVYQGAIYLLDQGATLWLHMVGVDNSLTLCDILNADARSCICYLPVTITTAIRKMPAELFRSSIWGWCKTASSQED